jgi:hypothetical protein
MKLNLTHLCNKYTVPLLLNSTFSQVLASGLGNIRDVRHLESHTALLAKNLRKDILLPLAVAFMKY